MSTATAVKPLPTPEQLRAYADQLPEIYRDVLKAFQESDPNRFFGDGLATGTLHAYLHGGRHNKHELEIALGRLEEAEFFRYDDLLGFYFPTPLGEELLAVVSGRRPQVIAVPHLPKPTW